MINYRKPVEIEFRNFSHGEHTVQDSYAIGRRQVQKAFNVRLLDEGFDRRPGSANLVDISGRMNGLHVYQQIDGTEHLLTVVGGKIYEVNTSTGVATERYDLGGSGEAWFADYLDTCFVCNGNGGNAKVEGNSAYQIGITAPAGVSAAAAAGGTLPDGAYEVYACYARKVSGVNRLYSTGQYLGTVTLGAGNNTVAITSFANSSDAQVNNKVIFMSDAGGSTYYFYHETGNNTTTSFNITSNANKSAGIVYSVVASPNTVPPDFNYLYAFNGRLWGSVENVVYYSLATTDADEKYDLEKFYALNLVNYPYDVTGIFSVGPHLYFNTKYGIIRQPYGDPSTRFEFVPSRWYFIFARTVCPWNNGVIGLTNDGVRFFDGERFYDYDISYDKRDAIAKMVNADTNFKPCGAVVRTNTRTEYHIGYQDSAYSVTNSNRRIVLNLDKLQFLPDKKVIAPWETWDNGATYFAVNNTNALYAGQSHATTSKIYTIDSNNTIDDGIYLGEGSLGTSDSKVSIELSTYSWMERIDQIVRWNMIRVMAKHNTPFSIEIVIRDFLERNVSFDIGSSSNGGNLFVWGVSNWGEDVWSAENPRISRKAISATSKGAFVYIKITQTSDDSSFRLYSALIQGVATKTRFT